MKKIIVVLFALIMISSFSACGSDSSSGGGEKKYKSSEFIDLMESRHYYMDATIIALGIEMPTKMAVDGEDVDYTVDAMGYETRTLILGDKAYLISDKNKEYQVIDAGGSDAESAKSAVADYSDYGDIEFTEKGKEAIPDYDADTAEYEFEKFSAGGDDGIVMTYYYKDDSLYCIYAAVGDLKTYMIINELSSKIPDGMLSLPDGYSKVETINVL